MFQERNKRCCYGCYLCRRYVHEVDLIGRYHREVGIQTSLDSVVLKCSIFIDGSITLCDNLTLLDFSRHIDYLIVLQVDMTVLDLAIRSLDKAEVVDFGIHAQRADKTDVGSFRSLDGTQTSIVGVVYVTYLEAGTLTRQTTGA